MSKVKYSKGERLALSIAWIAMTGFLCGISGLSVIAITAIMIVGAIAFPILVHYWCNWYERKFG